MNGGGKTSGHECTQSCRDMPIPAQTYGRFTYTYCESYMPIKINTNQT